MTPQPAASSRSHTAKFAEEVLGDVALAIPMPSLPATTDDLDATIYETA